MFVKKFGNESYNKSPSFKETTDSNDEKKSSLAISSLINIYNNINKNENVIKMEVCFPKQLSIARHENFHQLVKALLEARKGHFSENRVLR